LPQAYRAIVAAPCGIPGNVREDGEDEGLRRKRLGLPFGKEPRVVDPSSFLPLHSAGNRISDVAMPRFYAKSVG
jgi:hypothetical protein